MLWYLSCKKSKEYEKTQVREIETYVSSFLTWIFTELMYSIYIRVHATKIQH